MVLITREAVEEGRYTHLFSVRGPQLTSHALVKHFGDDKGRSGSWSCTKDGEAPCRHIREARNVLLKLNGEDTNGGGIPLDVYSIPARNCKCANLGSI